MMNRSIQTTLTLATRALLRPLVRLLVCHGIPLGVLVECVRKTYLEETRKESRSKRRWKLENEAVVFKRYERAVRLITGWIREKEFHDHQGRPALLPVQGARKSFAGLTKRFAGDIPVQLVLEELLEIGAVVKVANQRYKLVERAYIPRAGKGAKEEKLRILGTDVADLISTILHNLTHLPKAAYFQRKVAYDNLPAEFLPALLSKGGKKAQKFLEDLDRLMSRQDRDCHPKVKGRGRKRAGFGVYYFEEDFNQRA